MTTVTATVIVIVTVTEIEIEIVVTAAEILIEAGPARSSTHLPAR